jgi:predicted nucleic acid-binding protein
MWIVDSSVWIDYFNGKPTPQTERLDLALGTRDIGSGDLVLCEVLQGFRQAKDFEAARQALLPFPVFEMGGVELALQSAMNYRALRQRGITIRKTIDCLIATFVIEHGFELLHSDQDFEPFQQHLGLTVVVP